MGATAIERDGWGAGGLKGARDLLGARGSRETGGSLERWARLGPMAMERDGWGLAAMGATAMGCVGGGVSAGWGVTAIERNGLGLAAMAKTAMGRVGDGASA